MNDLQATNHLIQRSLQITEDKTTEGVKLIAKGSMADLKVSFIESQSVLHQLEVVCENAVIYPEIDAGFPTIRRPQMLDAMLRYNGMDPVLMYLDQEEQLLVGNAVMQLIQARTGSIKGALPSAGCRLKLKAIGLLISIDDFGTGYSSLAYLRDLPADEVKLDRSFIQTLVHSEQDKAIVKAILDLAKVFRFTVTAEGVEDEEQLAVLKALGCQHYQGFLTSRPLPVKALESLLGATPAG